MSKHTIALAGVIALAATAPAFAQDAGGVDFSSLTSGISFAGVVTALLAVAAVKVLPLVAKWGAGKILSMIGR